MKMMLGPQQPPERAHSRTARVAILADLIEEKWPSMDLVADMLVEHLPAAWEGRVGEIKLFRPPFRRRLSALIGGNGRARRTAWTFDRLVNRFFDYPRALRHERGRFDLFHLADHSYSQVVHVLPPGRTVVTCHDVDTFRCLTEPHLEKRGPVFRAMTRRILSGMQKAAHVCCDSEATRNDLLARRLIAPERMSVVPLGLHPEFLRPSETAADLAVQTMLDHTSADFIDLVHVGSVIPRKRIDLLLEIFAQLRAREPRLRLLRVGGPFSPEQRAHADRLGVAAHICVLPFLTVPQLAAIYRRAVLALLPSEAEGFGFPVIEAMACGTPVLASDLPVLREVGGSAASYAPVADVDAWVASATTLLHGRANQPALWEKRRAICQTQARTFTWERTAGKMAEIYAKVLAPNLR